ncbi:Ubiquitin carboxyl-terminal hydrolase 10-A [Eumeta japonica]|uniref:ubiquitinyl hydrolase 1 n=1 Tax=Eumeta variegata TaxID=151549 RepID=A0A4C1UC44_EUMVA|nr:Ubiquitin carboxyl-terminal hydrolase 10-A [Eumeta japonica]
MLPAPPPVEYAVRILALKSPPTALSAWLRDDYSTGKNVAAILKNRYDHSLTGGLNRSSDFLVKRRRLRKFIHNLDLEPMTHEYEFLDLSDVKEAELSSLQCALYERHPAAAAPHLAWADPVVDLSSCSSSTADAPTVTSSLDSLSGGECEMAPHSPQRVATGAGAGAGAAAAGAGTHQTGYGQPPPPPYPPPQQWPVVPPNVYVSQVTANVNVHGFMGQYYQPPQQYAPPQTTDRPQRAPRRERRHKRTLSPPHHPASAHHPTHHAPPASYYLQYPPYYPTAQAQGAPLYHLPVYQPLAYVGAYPYQSYYPEYPLPVEGDAVTDKGPDEYAQEVLMEQEAVDAYYAGAHYAPPYGPPPDAALEYMPPVYLPAPHPHPPPAPAPVPPISHHTMPHQFNVHAKNFVQNQAQNKTYTPQPQDKPPEQKTPLAAPSTSTASVESLSLKDLKIGNKGPSSPTQTDRSTDANQTKNPVAQNEKVSPVLKTEAPKLAWTSNEQKAPDNTNNVQSIPASKAFPTVTPTSSQNVTSTKITPTIGKVTKGPAAPFSSNKQTPKSSTVPQAAVPVQQAASTPKPPFGNRQKREGSSTKSPSNENSSETPERNNTSIEHAKREPPLPPSKAPMPISITLNSQGPPVIVTNKAPFGHSRKSVTVSEPPPAPQPPPPAPTASDFPPPPTPRNRGEPAPAPVVVQQPQTAPGKSWASLFSNKTTIGSTSLPSSSAIEEPASPTITAPPISVQKPVAKVPPFDASPVQMIEKSATLPRTGHAAANISYSEKTSVNAVSSPAQKSTSPVPEKPEQPKDITTPIQPSPFADDPNSYRMGEFLSKYQLDNRPVALLPRGLTNRSNYCYVNAILQALIACPPFYNMLKALPYQTRKGKSSTPVIDAMVELCYEFTPLSSNGRISRARGSESASTSLPIQTGQPLDPSAVQRVLRALRPFPSQEGRQEDAEEFLGCLLNGLNDEMLELIKLVEPEESKEGTPPNGVVATEPPPEDDDDDEWKVMGPKNKGAIERRWSAGRTPLSDIFRGRTRCRLHRAPHHDVTDAVQPFFTLQLDMERTSSVKEALELLAGKDALEGVSDAWQQLSLEQLPVVLLLHLKCFQLDAEGHTAKIVKNVDFTMDLKIDPKIISSKLKYTPKQRMYKLFAVVYHEGVEAVKGHYLTDTYHGQAGWIRYDDSTVTLVSDGQVLKPKPPRMPYLLMYRRQDTLPVPHRPTNKAD